MTQLATRNGTELRDAQAQAAVALLPRDFNELKWLSEQVAASGMFVGVKNPEQVATLMMVCMSEGRNPIDAIRRYHVIQGRPAMRSDAIQAEMLARGWAITPQKMTAAEAKADFRHPTKLPGGCELGVTLEQYKAAGLTTKDNWRNYPDDMLWARLVAKACRRFDPGVIAGIYSTEEVEDMAAIEAPAAVHARVQGQAAGAVAAAEVPVWGQAGAGFDGRPYHSAVSDAAGELNRRVADAWEAAFGADRAGMPKSLSNGEAHAHLIHWAIQRGLCERPPSQKSADVIKALDRAYKAHRGAVRTELMALVEGLAAQAEEAVRGRRERLAAAEEHGEPDDIETTEAGARG